TNPSFLLAFILRLNEVGHWKIGGDKPTGLVLWILWAVEAAVIVGAAAIGASSTMEDEPYCETCNTWCKVKPLVAEFQPCDPAELKMRLEAKDLKLLEGLGAPTAEADRWLEAKLHQCGTCESTNTLTMEMVTAKTDRANRAKARRQKSTSKK